MSELPQVSGDRLIRVLLKHGFVELRRTGGHAILKHRIDATRRATVPLHGSKDIRPGTRRAILKGAGVSIEDLRNAL